MIAGVIVFNFGSEGFAWRRRQHTGDDGGGNAAAATVKQWQQRQQQRRWRRGLYLAAETTQWQQWRQREWNRDGETAETGKVADTPTAVAWDLLGGNDDAMAKMSEARLEWQLRNGGDGQGGGDKNLRGAGFA